MNRKIGGILVFLCSVLVCIGIGFLIKGIVNNSTVVANKPQNTIKKHSSTPVKKNVKHTSPKIKAAMAFNSVSNSSLKRLMLNLPSNLKNDWKKLGGRSNNTVYALNFDLHKEIFFKTNEGYIYHVWENPDHSWFKQWELMGNIKGGRMSVVLRSDKVLEVDVPDKHNHTQYTYQVFTPNSPTYWTTVETK